MSENRRVISIIAVALTFLVTSNSGAQETSGARPPAASSQASPKPGAAERSYMRACYTAVSAFAEKKNVKDFPKSCEDPRLNVRKLMPPGEKLDPKQSMTWWKIERICHGTYCCTWVSDNNDIPPKCG